MSDNSSYVAPKGSLISRESLIDGSFITWARAIAARLGGTGRTDEELKCTCAQFLAERPQSDGIWVYGYGSLMWNPAINYVERRGCTLEGWHRSFCIWAPAGRGTLETPSLLLALEHGGQAQGIAFRLPPGEEEFELALVWQREMFGDFYVPRWVSITTDDGPIEGVAFVANPDQARYAGELPDAEVANTMARARGDLGTSAEYLEQTVFSIEQLGLSDERLERIRLMMRELLVKASPG